MQINVTGQSQIVPGYNYLETKEEEVKEVAVEAFEESLDEMRTEVESELKRRGVRLMDSLGELAQWWQDLDEDADVREEIEKWSYEQLGPAMQYGWSDSNLAESLPEELRTFADAEGINLERVMRGFHELLEVVRAELNGETYTATGESDSPEATDQEVLRAVGLMYFGLSIDEEA